MTKKRHHFVPRAYLQAFVDDKKRVHVFRKDDVDARIYQSPENFAFHKYYYSQTDKDGNRDNRLEDLFSDVETTWPHLVQRMRNGHGINDEVSLSQLFEFMALQRVRVPATRDLIELAKAEEVKLELRKRNRKGELPPLPKGLENLLDQIVVAIDPQQSLIAMARLLERVGVVLSELGYQIVHNRTQIPFLTSDNPVVWFDPVISEKKLQPYAISKNGPIALYFPISPDCMIYGHTTFHSRFVRVGCIEHNCSDENRVRSINRMICRFAYQAVFSRDESQRECVRDFANISPILKISYLPGAMEPIGVLSQVFGARTTKPKWDE